MNFANNFLKIATGISAIMLSASALFYTLSPARATSYIPNTTSNVGRYMIDYNYIPNAYNGKALYSFLVWDTETGASRLYYYNYDSRSCKLDGPALPDNPLD